MQVVKVPEKKITAADIRAALRRRYCQPESTVVFEVAQGTGHMARRHLDAVAMELWPSRGMALHGIEIKVSRSDYRREAADPQKAEEIARFCDYFWIAAPVGLIDIADLPSAWGLLELLDGRFRIAKQAVKTEAQALTRHFLAAMMRASDRPKPPEEADAQLAARAAELESSFQQRVTDEAKRMLGRNNEDAQSWRKLEDALKEKPGDYIYDAAVISAVRFVLATKFIDSYSGVRHLHDQMAKMVTTFAEQLDSLQVPGATEGEKLQRALSRNR